MAVGGSEHRFVFQSEVFKILTRWGMPRMNKSREYAWIAKGSIFGPMDTMRETTFIAESRRKEL